MVPSVTAAEQTNGFTQYALALKESIAITFKIAKADLPAGATKVEFWKNDACVQEVAIPAESKADGYYWFICNKIAPHEMNVDITAKLYVGDVVAAEATKKVTDYSTDVLGDAKAAQGLKKLVVDMLHYGAASQAYVGDSSAKVNAGLTAEQLAWGSDTTVDPVVTYVGKQSEAAGTETAAWNEVSLTLGDSVMMTFTFTAETVEGLSVALSCGEKEWVVDEFKSLGNNLYSFNFVGLNPAMMREEVEAVIKSGDTAVSTTVTYSIASYASKVMGDANASAELKALVKAMIRYGDSAAAYVETPDAAHDYDENGHCTVCTTAHYAVGKNVFIEAEGVDRLTDETTLETNSNYSGGNAIRLNGSSNTSADADPLVSVNVTPEVSGTYYIWIRMFNGGKRFHIYVDDDVNTNQQYVQLQPESPNVSTGNPSNATCDPIWMQVESGYTWTAGESYMIRFRNRDALVRLDQIVVTKDADFNPVNHQHTHGGAWEYDADSHWQEVTCCKGATPVATAHTYTNGVCVCGKSQYLYTTIEAEDCTLKQTSDDGTKTLASIVETDAVPSGKVVELADGVIASYTYKLANDPKTLSFTYTPELTDTYFVWVCLKNRGSSTSLRSYVEGVDTNDGNYKAPSVYSRGYPRAGESEYGWYKVSQYEYNAHTATWSAGTAYTVQLTNYHQVQIDKFVVTNDPTYAPNGTTYQEVATTNGTVTVQAEAVVQNPSLAAIQSNPEIKFQSIGVPNANTWTNYHATQKNLPGALGFNVKADAAGTYTIWAKVKVDNLARDTIFVSTAAKDAEFTYVSVNLETAGCTTVNTYKYVKIGTYTTSADGEIFSIRLRQMHANIVMDELVITNDSTYTPS